MKSTDSQGNFKSNYVERSLCNNNESHNLSYTLSSNMKKAGQGNAYLYPSFPASFMNKSIHSGMLFFPDNSFNQLILQTSQIYEPMAAIEDNNSSSDGDNVEEEAQRPYKNRFVNDRGYSSDTEFIYKAYAEMCPALTNTSYNECSSLYELMVKTRPFANLAIEQNKRLRQLSQTFSRAASQENREVDLLLGDNLLSRNNNHDLT